MDDQPVTRKELVEALGTTETRIRTGFQESLAATESKFQEALAATETRIRTEIRQALGEAEARLGDALREAVRDSQREMSKAFLSLERASLHVRALEEKFSNLDAGLSARVESVEKRLFEIEKKLLMKPPAA